MRLGTETGSVMNHLHSRMTEGQPEPVVGMGATILAWSDRYAGTIVEVWQGKGGNPVVRVCRDRAVVVKGSEADGSAEYAYEQTDTLGSWWWRFDGPKGWRPVEPGKQGWVLSDGWGLRIGERREYRDPSF